MSKQDRQGARTAQDLEYKYSFGKTFAEVMGYATDARNAANEAKDAAKEASGAVNELDRRLDQEEVFNRLTNNGQTQGIYREPETGEIYINASYLATGIITSADGTLSIDLINGSVKVKTERKLMSTGETHEGQVLMNSHGMSLYGWDAQQQRVWPTLKFSAAYTSASGYQQPSTIDAGTAGVSILGEGEVNIIIGMTQNNVKISGSTLEIMGKKAQWSLNDDGTFTLKGRNPT